MEVPGVSTSMYVGSSPARDASLGDHMKVSIGPYPKSHKSERKISIRIDKYDTWSMDSTLAMIILPMLKQLKATKHGAPNTDSEDVPGRLRDRLKKRNHASVDANHFKRWDWILDEMIWAFEQKNTDWERKFHTGKIDMLWQGLDINHKPIGKPKRLKDREKGEGVEFYSMIKGPKDTHVFDKKGWAKHHARMQNGFKLFGKYFENLWD
jgi:hypothetical protein